MTLTYVKPQAMDSSAPLHAATEIQALLELAHQTLISVLILSLIPQFL